MIKAEINVISASDNVIITIAFIDKKMADQRNMSQVKITESVKLNVVYVPYTCYIKCSLIEVVSKM